MRPPTPDGRTVRDLNGGAIDSTAQAQAEIETVLRAFSNALGSPDPVVYLRAGKAAIAAAANAQQHLRAVSSALQSIEEICAANAVRGAHKE